MSDDRHILPQRRASETFEIAHGNQRNLYIVTVSRFADDPARVAEIFVTGAKSGSALEAVARDAAIMVSIALQHGAPLKAIQHSITREQDGAPSTVIGAVIDRLLIDEPA
jgi:hypothetical protein